MSAKHPGYRCPKSGKVGYLTEQLAHAEAKFMRKRLGPKLYTYECDYCAGWHIGHRVRKRVDNSGHK